MDRRAWQDTSHGVAKSDKTERLTLTFTDVLSILHFVM